MSADKERVVITLGEDGVIIRENTSSGAGKTKNVSLDDLISAFTSDIIQTTGLLSRGVREIFSSGDQKIIVVEVAPKIRKVKYVDEQGLEYNLEIPFPSLMFAFLTVQDKLTNSWCYATKTSLSKEDVQMFFFPFGNIHSDGKICWGDTKFMSTNKYNASNVSGLVTRFLAAPFNRDLGANTFVSPSDDVRTTFHLMRSLHGVAEFPDKVLKPVTSYKNLIKTIFDSCKMSQS